MSQAVSTSKLDIFLQEAHRQFNLHPREVGDKDTQFNLQPEEKRGKYNQFYLDVPLRLSRGQMVSYDAPAGNSYELTNALIFLTGVDSPYTVPVKNQSYADDPSVSFIVGQYGLGKTELVFHVCHHMEGGSVRPLPINLGLSHRYVNLIGGDAPPTRENFAELLFGQIVSKHESELGGSFVEDELLPRIREGSVVLLLDGLDELISTSKQHNNFFLGLMSFLKDTASEEEELLFRIVISMRLEYLSIFAPLKEATELVQLINPPKSSDPETPVYFLVLDYLGDSHIEAYLDSRLSIENAFAKVRNYNRILDMLRRPLLLKLFCDMAISEGEGIDSILDDLKEHANPASLLKRFVKETSEDPSLNQDQGNLTDFTWDNEKLSDTSLDLYRFGESDMKISDVKKFLKPNKSGRRADEIKDLDAAEVLKSIHKCPFLKQGKPYEADDPDYVVSFAHRIFLEYFTAKAIANELNFPESDANQERTRAFDELVLNVDMRKFLRGLVKDEELWFRETRKAYGLNDEDEWGKYYSSERIEFLNTQRELLLMSMTDPESPPHNEPAAEWFPLIRKTVEWFLEEEQKCLSGSDTWLHPRYLIYNYEAVAVYLWYHRWESETKNTSMKFEKTLSMRLANIMDDLKQADAKLRKPNELLLERILNIAQRFRYSWVRKYNDEKEQRKLLNLIPGRDSRDIKERIREVFKDIKNTVF